MSTTNSQFRKIISSLDDDEALFSELASPVAEQYELMAVQVQLLTENQHFEELQKIAHKLKATWSLYIDEFNLLPEKLESAIKQNNNEEIVSLAKEIENKLQQTAINLKGWLADYAKQRNSSK